MLVACKECGSSVSDAAVACYKCGATLDVFLGVKQTCSECGADYRAAFEACRNCGAPRSVALQKAPESGPARARAGFLMGHKFVFWGVFVLAFSLLIGSGIHRGFYGPVPRFKVDPAVGDHPWRHPGKFRSATNSHRNEHTYASSVRHFCGLGDAARQTGHVFDPKI